jgi:hypothetical protein
MFNTNNRLNVHLISLLAAVLLFIPELRSQEYNNIIESFRLYSDVKITIDKPLAISKKKKTIVIFFALPNGNTTEQTMGKKMQEGDDWHFNIQHIRAQTAFIRRADKKTNYIVIYLENIYKSWPAWKQRHLNFKTEITWLVDSLSGLFAGKNKAVYLNGHSGGGSFIFGYLAGVEKIPASVKRISFLDSNYGYDSSYYPKFRDWLRNVKGSALNLFAYNDSVALFNGKPVVSSMGGTWYRGRLMMRHLSNDMSFSRSNTDSLDIYMSQDERVQFFFKYNFNRGIYHTQQVELNGFIHSIFCGTKKDSKGYMYYGQRAYKEFIQ